MVRGAFWEELGEYMPADHVLSQAEIDALIVAARSRALVAEPCLSSGMAPTVERCFELVEGAADHVDRCIFWLGADAEGVRFAEAALDRAIAEVARFGVVVG